MTRKQVKAHIDTVMKAVGEKADATAHKKLLEQYLTNGIFLLKDETVIKPTGSDPMSDVAATLVARTALAATVPEPARAAGP